jgi:hypothetical protein
MRRFFSPPTIAVVAALVLGASACGSSGAASSRSDPSTTTSPRQSIYHASGKGSGKTAAFTTPTSWTLKWYWNCGRRRSLATVSVGSSVLYHNVGIGGGGSHHFRSVGRHVVTFRLPSSCTWSATVLK